MGTEVSVQCPAMSRGESIVPTVFPGKIKLPSSCTKASSPQLAGQNKEGAKVKNKRRSEGAQNKPGFGYKR